MIITLLSLAALAAVVLGVGYYIRTTYTVQTVYVDGNVHYTEDEIKAIVMDGFLGDNSLYLSMKYKNRGVEGIPFVDVMDVAILAPDTIKITVFEKALTGYVHYLDSYIYFDKDGYVLECSSVKTGGVPQIMGLSFDHAVLGQPLPVENPGIFESILNITRLLKKYQLDADKIYYSKSGTVTLSFSEVKVALGSDTSRLEDKLMLLPELLPSLADKKGTLQMTAYDESGGRYTFKPE